MTDVISTQSLVILEHPIRRDERGRYSLNDLWRAAGGHERHKPSNYKDLQGTQELLAALQKAEGGEPLVAFRGGNSRGVWASQQIVYDFAMWISPDFRLTVIEAFNAFVNAHDGAPPALPKGKEDFPMLPSKLSPDHEKPSALQTVQANRAQVPSLLPNLQQIDEWRRKAEAYDELCRYMQYNQKDTGES